MSLISTSNFSHNLYTALAAQKTHIPTCKRSHLYRPPPVPIDYDGAHHVVKCYRDEMACWVTSEGKDLTMYNAECITGLKGRESEKRASIGHIVGEPGKTFTIHLDCTNYFVKNQDPFYPDLQGTLCFGKDHRDYVTALVTHSAEGSYELVFNGALLEETNFKPFSFGEHRRDVLTYDTMIEPQLLRIRLRRVRCEPAMLSCVNPPPNKSFANGGDSLFAAPEYDVFTLETHIRNTDQGHHYQEFLIQCHLPGEIEISPTPSPISLASPPPLNPLSSFAYNTGLDPLSNLNLNLDFDYDLTSTPITPLPIADIARFNTDLANSIFPDLDEYLNLDFGSLPSLAQGSSGSGSGSESEGGSGSGSECGSEVGGTPSPVPPGPSNLEGLKGEGEVGCTCHLQPPGVHLENDLNSAVHALANSDANIIPINGLAAQSLSTETEYGIDTVIPHISDAFPTRQSSFNFSHSSSSGSELTAAPPDLIKWDIPTYNRQDTGRSRCPPDVVSETRSIPFNAFDNFTSSTINPIPTNEPFNLNPYPTTPKPITPTNTLPLSPTTPTRFNPTSASNSTSISSITSINPSNLFLSPVPILPGLPPTPTSPSPPITGPIPPNTNLPANSDLSISSHICPSCKSHLPQATASALRISQPTAYTETPTRSLPPTTPLTSTLHSLLLADLRPPQNKDELNIYYQTGLSLPLALQLPEAGTWPRVPSLSSGSSECEGEVGRGRKKAGKKGGGGKGGTLQKGKGKGKGKGKAKGMKRKVRFVIETDSEDESDAQMDSGDNGDDGDYVDGPTGRARGKKRKMAVGKTSKGGVKSTTIKKITANPADSNKTQTHRQGESEEACQGRGGQSGSGDESGGDDESDTDDSIEKKEKGMLRSGKRRRIDYYY